MHGDRVPMSFGPFRHGCHVIQIECRLEARLRASHPQEPSIRDHHVRPCRAARRNVAPVRDVFAPTGREDLFARLKTTADRCVAGREQVAEVGHSGRVAVEGSAASRAVLLRVVPVERCNRATLRIVTRRTWMFILVRAILGAALGLVSVLVYDPRCMCALELPGRLARANTTRSSGGSPVRSPFRSGPRSVSWRACSSGFAGARLTRRS